MFQPFRSSSVSRSSDETLRVSEPGATVERMSYGERIILRPDPPPSDRGYEKGG